MTKAEKKYIEQRSSDIKKTLDILDKYVTARAVNSKEIANLDIQVIPIEDLRNAMKEFNISFSTAQKESFSKKFKANMNK